MSVKNWKVLGVAGTIKIGLTAGFIYFSNHVDFPANALLQVGSIFPATWGLINLIDMEDILINNLHKTQEENKNDDRKHNNKKD